MHLDESYWKHFDFLRYASAIKNPFVINRLYLCFPLGVALSLSLILPSFSFSSTEVMPSTQTGIPALKPLEPPSTSMIEGGRRRNAVAPLAIETETGTNYLVKFVSKNNPKDTLLIFVKGGQKYSTKIPPGTYTIRAAQGSTWYGRKDLFEPDTRFFRLRDKGGNQTTFRFYRAGNTVYGMSLSFKLVALGNIEQETINRDDF